MDNEESLSRKAQNYFKLAEYGKSVGMKSESASNYFKSLSAINDLMLLRKELRAKNHFERFALLKEHIPFLYNITNSLFLIYRETYTGEIEETELIILKNKILEAFDHANIKTTDN